LYTIAVNPTRRAVRATMTAPGLAGRSVDVLGENRSLSAAGDSLTDGFAPLAVHLYVAPPA
jgi:hypothetical protein